MTHDYQAESLVHDPIHGYISFTSRYGIPSSETSEQEIIDNPWVQRMRQIHQLQTAWWVFPSAEHMRFQHVLGAMHLAGRVTVPNADDLPEDFEQQFIAGLQRTVVPLSRLPAVRSEITAGPLYGMAALSRNASGF